MSYSAPNEPVDDTPEFQARGVDAATAATLGGGALLAGVFLAVPLLRRIFECLTILIHEFGHAIVGWLFGYPSLPAFDFLYGGGITTMRSRSTLMLGVVYLLWAGLLTACWRNRKALAVVAVGLALFALCAHTGAHEVIILFMGHGMELAIAGVFLYRAWSGSAVVHAVERPLYAACGFFIVFADVGFAWRLWRSPLARAQYANAKGGGHWMDFSRIARDHLGVELPTVAFFFLLCCVLPLVLSWLVYRYHDWVFDRLARLVQRHPDDS